MGILVQKLLRKQRSGPRDQRVSKYKTVALQIKSSERECDGTDKTHIVELESAIAWKLSTCETVLKGFSAQNKLGVTSTV